MSLPVLSDAALDQLFRQARTVHAFKPDAVSDETIHQLYDLLKWGPTAFNGQPARYVFVKSAEAKAKLMPALSPGNVPQVQSAAVTVIVAYDTRFPEHLPTQFPGYDAKRPSSRTGASRSTSCSTSAWPIRPVSIRARLGWRLTRWHRSSDRDGSPRRRP